jgi:carboxyl-terminal processing protease
MTDDHADLEPDRTTGSARTAEATEPARRRPPSRTPLLALLVAAVFIAGIAVGRIALPGPEGAGPTTPGPTAAGPGAEATFPPPDFDMIREAWDLLHEQYVGADTLDDRALIHGAIDGMTEAVGDTGHTGFLTPEERAARTDALSGSYVGIGVQVDTDETGLPLVVGVFRESPAAEAGLAPGDVILEVDGRSTAGVDLDEVVGWVRGEEGTEVTLAIRSGVDGPQRAVTLTRADVQLDPVSSVVIPGTTIGLLRLEQFQSGSGEQLTTALRDLREAGADRLILDLRGNPGGYVNEAVTIASQFLESGTVYIERDAQGTETPHPVTEGGAWTDLPLVVLIDGASASSSEIVSGAIQDAGRATLVGVQTFGTGTVLGEFPLRDGSALRIGTVEWLTPDGRRIWHEGITPDVAVERAADLFPTVPGDLEELAPGEVAGAVDPQLERAIEIVAAR